MIEFATICIGKDWVFDWKDEITEFHNNHNLHLLTDCGDWFDFKSHKHDKEFSYYDKLIFLLDIMTLKKKRITYLDVDKLQQYGNIDYDTTSCYVYTITTTPTQLSNVFESTRKEIHNHLNIKNKSNIYTQEALISLPYTSDFENIKKDIIELQSIVESNFGNRKWNNSKLNRYSKHGIGYGEGSALTAVLLKYNINIVNAYSSFIRETLI
jgi:hypothetical protein